MCGSLGQTDVFALLTNVGSRQALGLGKEVNMNEQPMQYQQPFSRSGCDILNLPLIILYEVTLCLYYTKMRKCNRAKD